MKNPKILFLLISLLLLNYIVKAEEEAIAGEPSITSIVNSEQNILMFGNHQIDLVSHFNESISENDEFEIKKIEFLNLGYDGFDNSQVDFLTASVSTGDTTQNNDLTFDDDASATPTDPNAGLFPERTSLLEKAFWSKNGLFRLVGLTSELSPEQRTKEIGWRRTFLTAHQTSGIITLGLMIATCYAGQMYLDGKSKSSDLHGSLVSATIIGYSITGLLAFTTPPPSIRRKEFSTITVHKTLAWLHMAGMVLTPILGSMIEDSGADFKKKARFHQTSAYITTGLLATAMAVILLFE